MPAVSDTKDVGRERFVVLASLLSLVALAWLYLWIGATSMDSMSMGAGVMEIVSKPSAMAVPAYGVKPLLLTFLMWAVMMIGMMLPSAAPAILFYSSMVRKSREGGSALSSAWIFTAGYLAVWSVFSLAATVLQATLETQRLLIAPTMSSANAWLSGSLFIAAGIYQWLPAKDACLEKCRSPLQLFLFGWRPGPVGAFRMGAEHGFFCVGCCWALMLLLFAAGVMNLLWVALIAVFVFIEKLAPAGRLIGRIAGVGLAAAGAHVILANA